MKALMLQGTGSGVGKSVLVAALCRIFFQDGFCVAPFKAQNMALNSAITADGKEIGRAQAMQAYAAKQEPHVDMNPVLLKPKEDSIAQVIVLGKAVGDRSAADYHQDKLALLNTVKEAYQRLAKRYDLIIIEGAGSPAEVNLKDRDIVNMRIAQMADCPVLLVADIDKGGALAWVVGTLALLTEKEKALVKGIIINKFRGDKALLQPGIDFLERKTGKPVVGVIPYIEDLQIEEEDSASEKWDAPITVTRGWITIGIVKLQHISNFTDFDALKREPNVQVRYIADAQALQAVQLDALILPGTKNAVADLLALQKKGLVDAIRKLSIPMVGICGGFQMLGRKLIDKAKVESKYGSIEGLGLLKVESVFEKEKVTRQTAGTIIGAAFKDKKVKGYEIHMGRTTRKGEKPFLMSATGEYDGAISKDGRIWGTYLHGIFDNDAFRHAFIDTLRKKKGLRKKISGMRFEKTREMQMNRLAKHVRRHLDMKKIKEMLHA